uniref:ERF family protein n=1 Tax=Borreliella yangtzensis TaxID=683292 RepID=UPI003B215A72
MTEVTENQENIQNNMQAEIKFLNDMDTLRMNLPGIDKNLKGYGYNYQNYNEIVRVIKNVIKKHNLELGFYQNATFTHDPYGRIHVIRTTFYSKSTGYRESFDTRIHIDASKNMNSIPQLVGSAITYFKRYALVGHLMIESEVDTDAAPIDNNSYENENLTPNKQISVNQKQEQKQEINYNQKKTIIQNNKTTPFKNKKKDSFYHYGIFKEALSNIKNWVHDFETKENINSIIQKISFIQNMDPNNVDDVKKIEDDLKFFITKNAELKSPMFWAAIIKNHFKKTNRLKDLKDFDERFMPSDQRDYNDSPLIFFDSLKEDKQFDYIFAA